MAFVVEAKMSNDFKKEVLPAKTYVGNLYSIIDLGTQIGEYQGKPIRNKKIRLSRELPGEMRTFREEYGPQPFSISKEYTLSFADNAHLRKDLRGWRGHDISEEEEKSGIDLESMIGQTCLLGIGINKGRSGDEYNVINSISSLLDGMIKDPLINKPIIRKLEDGMNEVYQNLGKYTREKIEKCVERNDLLTSENSAVDGDDLPF